MTAQHSTIGPIIAIVDDDPGVRGGLDNLIRSAGMNTAVFSNARDLLAAENKDELACIFTDLHMPEMTGLELQAELNRQGSLIPVIVMTAYPTDAARDMAYNLGALDFVAKPLDADMLIRAVEAATMGRPLPLGRET